MSPEVSRSKLLEWVSGLLLVGGTVAVAGVGDRLLTGAGYPLVGGVFWALCYGSALFVVWFVWLRHVELTGPAEG